jgi:hypothetical protein
MNYLCSPFFSWTLWQLQRPTLRTLSKNKSCGFSYSSSFVPCAGLCGCPFLVLQVALTAFPSIAASVKQFSMFYNHNFWDDLAKQLPFLCNFIQLRPVSPFRMHSDLAAT